MKEKEKSNETLMIGPPFLPPQVKVMIKQIVSYIELLSGVLRKSR